MKTNRQPHNREQHLKNTFNVTIAEVLGLQQKDYHSHLTIEDMLRLKSVLSNINNDVTLRLTLSLGRWIGKHFSLSSRQIGEILTQIESTKSNANGYDIELQNPDLVAEVKGNIPCKKCKKAGLQFGAAQAREIIKDIKSLLNGKTKSIKQVDSSIKLLCFFNDDRVRRAVAHLLQTLKGPLAGKVLIMPSDANVRKLDPDFVYIVFRK